MIKTPLSTVIGGAFWTPDCTIIGGASKTLDQIIKSLFSDGTQGLYLNAQDALSVSDLSSIKDLSGNNNHALQANSTSRASLITDPSGYKSLKFDGIDDAYVTQSIDFSGTDKVTVIAAVRELSGATRGTIVELGLDGVDRFVFNANRVNSPSFSFLGKNVSPFPTISGIDSAVVTGTGNLLSKTHTIKVNNSFAAETWITGTTGKYQNLQLSIGRRENASYPFNGQIYALLVIGKLLDDATTQRIEKEFAKYIGVTL